MPLYALTIFLSAFLLFQVQPLLAKLILPWFGGSAAVWTVTLMFFQTLLLFGYGYAHATIRWLGPRRQAVVHTLLLLASCALLPILPSPAWRPVASGDPTARILLLLICTVGLPYFLLSASTPLLQAWFVRRTGSGMPYRLFALSNAGSLLALLSYPVLIEPFLSSRHQAWIWSLAYACFCILAATAAWTSRPAASAAPVAPAPAGERPTLGQGVRWALLAACPSALLLAVANHLSANVAPIPLLWILPLTLYLVTFILAFEWPGFYRRAVFIPLLFAGLAAMTALTYVVAVRLNLRWTLPGFLIGLFLCCLFCHGELARRRPAPAYLTSYYLMISLGGALGGCFVGLAAPHLFRSYLELPLGYLACGSLGLAVLWRLAYVRNSRSARRWALRLAGAAILAALTGTIAKAERDLDAGHRFMGRNFYGVLAVKDDAPSDPDRLRILSHGAIQHGSQFLDAERELDPTSYYGSDSGVGRAIRAVQARGPVRLGMIGLGAGVLSTYGRAGDTVRIYEINPLVERIAEEQFTFYPRNPARKTILLGDARLTLEAEPPQGYDLLAVDAFSGDAIPVHLLTWEAFQDYFRHLKPDGILAIHISNRYLNLEPVCAAMAEAFHWAALTVDETEDEDSDPGTSSSTWVLLSRGPDIFKAEPFEAAEAHVPLVPAGFRPWTDDYSNLYEILRLRGK